MPSQVPPDPQGILALLNSKALAFSGQAALSIKQDGRWKALTYGELSEKSSAISGYWIEHGFQAGDRIAILSESRPEWAVAFFAAVRCGAVVVPLDPKLTEGELSTILKHALPRVLFVSMQLRSLGEAAGRGVASLQRIVDFEEMMQLNPEQKLPGRERTTAETALIVYTSGTTGVPKGVKISFGNLVFQVQTLTDRMRIQTGDVFLSILPLNHLLELTGGLLCVLYAGGQVCYSQTLLPQEIMDALSEKKVAWMVVVPLFLKMLKTAIEKQAGRAGAIKREMFAIALGLSEILPRKGVRRNLFQEIHARLGGHLKGFISGGARLDNDIARFFERIGIPVYQGYGLTETSPVVAVNDPENHRLGSVGKPMPGVSVRIDERTGEILTRGPNLMQGYYENDRLTAGAIDAEGWFHTGDCGYLDNDGFLYLTSRIKDLIVLGGGKKVEPEEVEVVLGKSSQFKEVCVVGAASEDGNQEVVVVVVPADELKTSSGEDRAALRRIVEAEIWQLGKELAPFKRPVRVLIHASELPRTSTRKVRRVLVRQWVERFAGKPE